VPEGDADELRSSELSESRPDVARAQASHLAGITDADNAQLIRRFATWEVLPRLRTRAEKKPITPAGRRHACDQVKHATAFLRWLSGQGLTLPTCRQADIDAWHAEHNEHGRNTIRAFLRWCMTSRLTGRPAACRGYPPSGTAPGTRASQPARPPPDRP
jgi:hypothetical protein